MLYSRRAEKNEIDMKVERMKTNLIIVEGLPGSGKSTTAARIADELREKGEKVICVDEGVPGHPADYADYDFPDFETERMKILDKWHPPAPAPHHPVPGPAECQTGN